MRKPLAHRKQETEFYCGPAIVQMTLATAGIELSQEELARELKTTAERGTTIHAIETLLRSCGFAVTRKNGAGLADIERVLAADALAIVGYLESKERIPHYALVVKIDARHVYFLDPWHSDDHAMSRHEFEGVWRDDEIEAYGDRMLLAVAHPQ